MNDRVADYRDLVESLAHKFVGRNDAEFDDLVQEGLIFVWETLTKGLRPSAELIEGRMSNWVRLLGTQIGLGRRKSGEAIEYAQLLPIEPLLESETLSADPIPLPGHDALV